MSIMWMLAVAITMLACAGSKPPLAVTALTPRASGTLEVTLEFDGAADLDLHVSDPGLETVYFGNSPSESGGWLAEDVRCVKAGAPRVETIRFDRPVPGRYLVGVDHVKACRRLGKTSSYTIRVAGPGLEAERTDSIGPGEFNPRALEFDWPAGARD